jgi:subtilisin family serine protease
MRSAKAPEIVVAVIDSGVDWQHPELADNIWVNPKEIPDNNKDDDGTDLLMTFTAGTSLTVIIALSAGLPSIFMGHRGGHHCQ